MSICIRRATLDDQEAIQRFIHQAFQEFAPFKAEDRWCWQFVDNPFSPRVGPNVPVWLACEGANVVGQIAVQGTEVQVDGNLHPAGWIVDVMVLPACRGIGLGHRLLEAAARDVPLLLTLTMAPATRRMNTRAGAVTLGPTRQWSRWTRLLPDDVRRYLVQRTTHRKFFGAVVRSTCAGFSVHHMFAGVINSMLWLRRAIPQRSSRELTIYEVARFGEEVDALWAKVAADYPAICPRHSRFLNWRFTDCPQLKYKIFFVSRGNSVVGYLVLRRTGEQELRLGIIADVFAARADIEVFRTLIIHAIAYFGDDVASVECATSIPEITSVVQKLGFCCSRTLAPTAIIDDEMLRGRVEQLKRNWYFTMADHDWDQIQIA
jgi:GNAT superfamily N-acetyltransferase